VLITSPAPNEKDPDLKPLLTTSPLVFPVKCHEHHQGTDTRLASKQSQCIPKYKKSISNMKNVRRALTHVKSPTIPGIVGLIFSVLQV
jgi:hypothetical protein